MFSLLCVYEQSEISHYLSSTTSSSAIEIIEGLVDLVLIQRDLELQHFFNDSQTHKIVGITTSLIAREACSYVSISIRKHLHS